MDTMVRPWLPLAPGTCAGLVRVHNCEVTGSAACRAASEHSGPAQQKRISNGPGLEATQLQHMQRRIAAAEADAEGARAELLRACQQAEAAAADVARCNALDVRLQVLCVRLEYSSLPMYITIPCSAVTSLFFRVGLVMPRALHPVCHSSMASHQL